MRDTAFVTEIKGQVITVVPLIKNACLSCKEGCAKRGNPFEAVNSLNLELKKGSIVKIRENVQKQALQAVVSLLVPVFSACLCYFAVPFAKPLFAMAGIFAGAAAVYFLSKKKSQALPEIFEVCP